MNTYISIEYDEFNKNPVNIKVTVRRYNNETVSFSTGDIVKDWHDAMTLARKDFDEFGVHGMYSSSCDHFVMDVKGYRWDLDDILGDIIVRDVGQGPSDAYVKALGHA